MIFLEFWHAKIPKKAPPEYVKISCRVSAGKWQLARFSDPLSNFESRVEGSTNEIGYNSLLINIFFSIIKKKINQYYKNYA